MPDNVAYANLNSDFGMFLKVGGVPFQITHYVSSFAEREIPTAICVLATGRDLVTNAPAAIHTNAGVLTPMADAEVWFNPRGDYNVGKPWPTGPFKIFVGQVAGLAGKTVQGQSGITVHLVHWLAKLGFSSALTASGHVANPQAYNFSAVVRAGSPSAATATEYVGGFPGTETVRNLAADDLAAAIKTVFCTLAAIDALPIVPDHQCLGASSRGINHDAIEALQKIEGPGGKCAAAYKWGQPLKIADEGISVVGAAVAQSLLLDSARGYANTTFWDKLVNAFCPAFGLTVIPRVDSAIIAADLPTFSPTPTQTWRSLDVNQYNAHDYSGALDRPLRGVGVLPADASQTFLGLNSAELNLLGGCYVDPAATTGTFLIVGAPLWLRLLGTQGTDPGSVFDLSSGGAGPATGSATPPGPSTSPPPGTYTNPARTLYKRYAEYVYHAYRLRGHSGTLSSPLRFDIAPGSIVRLHKAVEKFTGYGSLDATVFARVQRVTIALDANSPSAGTAFLLDNVRTTVDGGASEHPLFGTKLHGDGARLYGAPLVDELAGFGE